ncbi:MAG TPA: MMPL family transporter [Gammaproteobacteria bacterium]|nr:MMPL family transporter [Gammaproteobacteria bacterium]
MPVVPDPSTFDKKSGNFLENLIFNNRILLVCVCALITIALAYVAATKLRLNASFEKMMPQSHPYIKNYLSNKDQLPGLGNSIRIAVENESGDIFEKDYLLKLQKINDDVFLANGVDRAWLKSLWMPAIRWLEATEEGFRGGPVMPDNYDGSQASTEQLRTNIARSESAQQLLSKNLRSSVIFVPLLDFDPKTGAPLDYEKFSGEIEEIRKKYESPSDANGQKDGSSIRMHIIGFAKLIGELIDGLRLVMGFFGIAVLISIVILFLYTHCVRSTVLVVTCCAIAVTCQLGLVALFGSDLDPFSILVPFLVFAIGVSHGAQKMNGIMQDIGRGTHKYVAARYTFRRLFMAGLTALLADAVGFAVLMVIDIPVIRELALTASIGVGVLVFTNLILLPVLLSFTGVSAAAASRSLRSDLDTPNRSRYARGVLAIRDALLNFTKRRWAIGAIGCAVLLTTAAFMISRDLKIGDLDPGAPELRPNSRYNRDNAFITSNYALSNDIFAVIVKTPPEGCIDYKTLVEADRLAWELRRTPGVQNTSALVDSLRQITVGLNEGNPKWYTIPRNQDNINYAALQAVSLNPDLFNDECSVMPIIAYLEDHKADTLARVSSIAEAFARQHNTGDVEFLLAAGSAGIEAATNEAVRDANAKMVLYVYAAVIALCMLTFRSWRATVVAILPLMMTSILCEALMTLLGIGVKVATLPVISLGVGIGVDYALYLLAIQLAHQRRGHSLRLAYLESLNFTGKIVALVGVTLAIGVMTWYFSPIKFQADMGILLTFMFLWNMIGALVLIPALSHFLLKSDTAVVAAGENPVRKAA